MTERPWSPYQRGFEAGKADARAEVERLRAEAADDLRRLERIAANETRLGATAAMLREALQRVVADADKNHDHRSTDELIGGYTIALVRTALAADPDEWLRAHDAALGLGGAK